MRQVRVSVVILNWNNADTIGECIAAAKLLRYDDYEIVVVDNGSTDGSTAILAGVDGIVLVKLERNYGFAGGQVRALPHCSGEFVALLNSDAVPDPDWLRILVETQQREARVGAVGGRAYIWDATGKSPDRFYSYAEINPYTGDARTLMRDRGCTQDVPSISGAAVLLDRKAIAQVGYFDPVFFAYYEETDLFARMKRAGFRILYEPRARVWHRIAGSLGADSFRYHYLMHRNRTRFVARNFAAAALWRYLRRYVRGEVKNLWLLLWRPRRHRRARAAAFAWNVLHAVPTWRSRRSQRLPWTYDQQLFHELEPRVTVMIPNFNHARFVADAIDSALGQSLPPEQVIVVDDGSTDDSRAVLARYRDDPRVRVELREHGGVIAARNHGLSLVDSEWVVFLDADDVLDGNYIEVTYRAWLAKNSDRVAFVYTDAIWFGARHGVQRSRTFRRRSLMMRNYVHSSALLRTSAVRAVGGYAPQLAAGMEDWDLYLALVRHGDVGLRTTGAALRYRQHAGTHNRNALSPDELAGIHGILLQRHAQLYNRWTLLLFRYHNGPVPVLGARLRRAAAYVWRGEWGLLRAKLGKSVRRMRGSG